jgi:hypothetical protein
MASFSSPRSQKNAAHHQLDDEVETSGGFDAVFVQPVGYSKVNLYNACQRLSRVHNIPLSNQHAWWNDRPPAFNPDTGAPASSSSSSSDSEPVFQIPRHFASLGDQRYDTTKPRSFACAATYNTADIFRARTHEVNACQSYSDAFAREQPYVLPVPWDPFVYQEFKEIRLDFMLENESTPLEEFVMKHVSEQDAFRTEMRVVLGATPAASSTEGVSPSSLPSLFTPVELVLAKDQILSGAGSCDRKQFGHRGYHIVPVHIEVVDVENSMPITWNVELSSSMAVRGNANGGGGATQWKRWRSAPGCCNSGDRQALNSYMLGPCAQKVNKCTRTLYTAPEKLNTPDFSRWITADFVHLQTAFNQLKPMQYDGMQCWIVKCPQPTDRPENISDVIFWFIASHFDELVEMTSLFGSTYGKKIDIFNKLTQSQTGEPCVWVVRRVVEDMLKMRARDYDKDEMLMNLDQVKLTITPALRTQGWQDLYKMSKNELTPHDPYARLRVSVRLVYHEYADRESITQ